MSRAVGELEVVVEAVLDRRADRDLGARDKLDTASAITCAASWRIRSRASAPLLGVTISIASPSARGAARSRSSPSTSHGERGLRQAGADRGRGVGARRPLGQLERLPSGRVTVIAG